MLKVTLNIEGMVCNMCETHINDTIRRNFIIKKVTSSHSKGITEIITETQIDEDKLKSVINKTGYTVTNIYTEQYKKKRFTLFK